MGAVVAVANLKGGVGKTTTTINLGGAIAAEGRRVLLVDIDPQASLSRAFFGPNRVESLGPGETVAALFAGGRRMPGELIRRTDFDRLDVLPGSASATDYNVPIKLATPSSVSGVREFLGRAKSAYDLVLIDCPPNLQALSFAALGASDFVVVPMQPEDPGSQGIRDVGAALATVRASVNPGLGLLGYLLTMTARETVQAVFTSMLRDAHGDLVFAETVPRSAAYKDAFLARRPIQNHSPRSRPASAIRAVASEMQARVARAASGDVIGTISGVA